MGYRDDPSGDQFFALKTYRQDGTPVVTPIWLAPMSEFWYAYTPGNSWKVRRIRQNSRVEIALSTYEGAPREPWRAGRARIVSGAEVRKVMSAKYGPRFRLFVLVLWLGRLRSFGAAVGLEISLEL
jgi:PPOX class probable F420-dependent enzyme